MLKSTIVAASLAFALSGAAFAQNQDGLVNVNVANVLSEIDVDLQEVISNNTVQVPIGIAANVCDVSANVLAEQAKEGGASCEAKTVTTAFSQQLEKMKKKG